MFPKNSNMRTAKKVPIKRLEVRPPRRTNAASNGQHEQMVKIRNFLTHTRWQEYPDPEGGAGLTWLEIFIWFGCTV